AAAATSARARIARRNRRAETSQVSVDPLLLREGTSCNGWQPTADALLTMERRRQPDATHGNRFRLFLRVSRPSDLRLVATGCNHGDPQGLHPARRAPPRRSLRGPAQSWPARFGAARS